MKVPTDNLLLVIGGGIESIPGIIKAKEMGLRVVVTDINPDAPATSYADFMIICSTYDISQTSISVREFIQENGMICGVISFASDVPKTVSKIAEEYNLPSHPMEAAILASNKELMNERFFSSGIPTAKYSRVYSLDELDEKISDFDFPVIVKPVDGRGARGVLLLRSPNDYSEVIHSFNQSEFNYLLIEEYLEGPQFSTEALIIDGIGYPIGFSDRNYSLLDKFSPYVIENGGDMPTFLEPQLKHEIENLAINAGKSLGAKNGIIKGDMVLTKSGPKVIEIALRLSGGFFSSHQIPLNTGVDLLKYAILTSIGVEFDKNDLTPKYNLGVAIRYLFPPEGTIEDIVIDEDLISKEYVKKFELFVKPGDQILKYTDHTKRSGYVLTTGKNKELAISNALRVVESICFKMK